MKKSDIVSIDTVPKKHKQNAISYALKSWTSTFNRMSTPNPYKRIERIYMGLLCEQAFESYLKEKKISYDASGKTRWYDADRYDIGINNCAIDLKSNFIDFNNPYIATKLSQEPDILNWFLDCTALVPLDQFNPAKSERRSHKKKKVYAFAFIDGKFENQMKNPIYVHAFWGYEWLKKGTHKGGINLGRLKFTSKSNSNSKIIIYGTSSEKNLVVEEVTLSSKETLSKTNFYQVFSLHLDDKIPEKDIKIECSNHNFSETIKPNSNFSYSKNADGEFEINENNWINIELVNPKIHILGWVDEESLRVDGYKSPRFDKKIEQYSETKVDNWAYPVSELNPMSKISSI